VNDWKTELVEFTLQKRLQHMSVPNKSMIRALNERVTSEIGRRVRQPLLCVG